MANDSKYTQTLQLKIDGLENLKNFKKETETNLNLVKSLFGESSAEYTKLSKTYAQQFAKVKANASKSILEFDHNYDSSDKADKKESKKSFNLNDFVNKQSKSIVANFSKNFQVQMSAVIKKTASLFTETFKNAFNQLAELGTYSSGTTLLSNSTARNQQLVYGLSDSQNYAMTQAMNALNMSTEDLMWMNDAQAAEYSKLTSIFQEQYSELASSGVMQNVQEMQIDFALMKQQFQMTIYKFISDHQTEILSFMNLVGNVLSAMLSVVGKIADFLSNINLFGKNFSWSSTTGEAASVTNSTNANITVNYTSGTDNSDKLSSTIYDSVLAALK
jgi:hypothetical protein